MCIRDRLSACAPNPSDGTEDSQTQIVATTYPVYLFACEVTRGVPDCTVTLMIDQPIGCLHDYTLTVKDMKALERADIIVCNGAGLEESMEDVYKRQEFILHENTPHLGIPLKDLEIRKGFLIVALLHENQVVVPSGGTVLSPGDRVIVISHGQGIQTFRDIFLKP